MRNAELKGKEFEGRRARDEGRGTIEEE
jgi:hypothetical protein